METAANRLNFFRLSETTSTGPSVRSWASLWAITASVTWLLPNHYYPWVAFHHDAWIAWTFLLGSAALIFTTTRSVPWHRLTVAVAILATVPLLQAATGLIVFAGQAWIATAYLLGFLLSLLCGAHAEKVWPEGALDALFVAIGLAAVLSVGLQLQQWLSVSGAEIWIVMLVGMRPFGNLAQPNQMGTFLLWGLLSVAWGVHKKKFSAWIGLMLALWLLFGIALTQSRTSMAAIVFLSGMACMWRRHWSSPRMVMATTVGLALYFFACVALLEPISHALLLNKPYSAVERITGSDVRWQLFKLFLDAALQKPWLGYGWITLAPAQIAVAETHPNLGGIFQQSHNLFLDLALWLGIPLGLAASLGLVGWLAARLRRVSNVQDVLLVMFVFVVALHAMLELPLHYAYMLLPTGLVAGALNTRHGAVVVFRAGRKLMVCLWLVAALLLALITRDYFLIEADFQALRFERAYSLPPKAPPRLFVLSQFTEFNRLGRSAARTGMSEQELEWMGAAADGFPSPSNLYVYTAALAMNGRAEEAHARMRKMAKIMLPDAYAALGKSWAEHRKKQPSLANVEWLPAAN